METKFNFKSQICTTREQSERLIALGLKKETADMMWDAITIIKGKPVQDVHWSLRPYYYPKKSSILYDNEEQVFIPAWSLHRLLCLYGADYTIKEVYNNAEECYGMLICAIEIAIEDGDFNEEYLDGDN